MKSSLFRYLCTLVILILVSCEPEIIEPEPFYEGGILFLGHTYMTDTTVDDRIEKIALKRYEHI